MGFIPDDALKGKQEQNLAPMIDFLFLMLMFFACLAVSRVTTKDTDISLVEIKPPTGASITEGNTDYKVINININAAGEYKWVTEIRDYVMTSADEIKTELEEQYEKGLLPLEKLHTQVFLKIDKNSTWEPILKAIFAIRDAVSKLDRFMNH
jgi:biopolymer transport protein ExbD